MPVVELAVVGMGAAAVPAGTAADTKVGML